MAQPNGVYITRPALPPLDEVIVHLERIWETHKLTNNGPMAQALEEQLCDSLGLTHLTLTSNCTLGLIAALRALDVRGEVITTPFSFVATANAIVMAGATPVFADIDPDSLNLSPRTVAESITERTSAIVAVHSYGHPCDIEGLQAIADEHGIPLIFDAAHCFGARLHDRSLLDFGTCSVVSFHATKVFNTFEGGAVITRDPAIKKKVDRLINHGIDDEINAPEIGLNAKMSEFHAAIGLAQLPYVSNDIARRGALVARYLDALKEIEGLCPVRPIPEHLVPNNYMFPILVDAAYPLSRDELFERLKRDGIFARMYFFPLISDLPSFRDMASAARDTLPVAGDTADRILCLPLFPDLELKAQDRIIDLLRAP
ncbi:dTDP-4-amino-4,6-dideoxy-D-glucose transaminase [Roseovarius sp. THAF9]|nr:dTDP-4-amino-4,6-dideoxy-D-glucose transaminase [Roseovarius sp. THAF9]